MKLGILGLGTVGGGVWEILNSPQLKKYDITLKTAVVRGLQKYTSYQEQGLNLTQDAYEMLNDPDIDVVVEVMGGIDTPYEYIKYALSNQKHVVTANKAVLARHFEEFINIARENKVTILYEASVGGGIPLIKPLRQNARINEFYEISGILNGTSNFILSKMSKEALDFSEVLKLAQDMGYAEVDPSDDIDGVDVARKLSVISSTVFEKNLPLDKISVSGIRNISASDMEFAASRNMDIKLIATANYDEKGYFACVEPVILCKSSIFAQVSGAFNIGMAKGDNLKEVSFYGEGAGRYATANAVISDLLDIYLEENIKLPEIDFSELDVSSKQANYYIRIDKNEIKESFLEKVISKEQIKIISDKMIILNGISLGEIQKITTSIGMNNSEYFVARIDASINLDKFA